LKKAKKGKEMNRSLRDVTGRGSQVEMKPEGQAPDSLERTVKVLHAVADLSVVRKKNKPSADRQMPNRDPRDCLTAKKTAESNGAQQKDAQRELANMRPSRLAGSPARGIALTRGQCSRRSENIAQFPEIAATRPKHAPGRNIRKRLRKSATVDR
jgi:hypothetical protein